MEILKKSTGLVKANGYDICNLVHDSIWTNVKEKSEVDAIQGLMENWTTEAFDLPFYVEAKRLKRCVEQSTGTDRTGQRSQI